MEHLFIPLTEFRAADGEATGDPGGFKTYVTKWYDVDCYNDICLPGTYQEGLPSFLQRGFTCNSHDWGYDGTIGYPTQAIEDSVGLLVENRFHSTEDAQMVRTKVMERMEAGLKSFTSAGFITTNRQYIEGPDFTEALAAVVPPHKLADTLKQCEGLDFIGLVRGRELYENSIVTAPGLASAEVVEVRSAAEHATALGAGTCEEQLAAALGAVAAVVERRKSIAAKREERSGKKYSAATVAKIKQLRDAANTCMGHCDDMIAEAESPDETMGTLNMLALEAEIAKARRRLRLVA